MLFCYEFYFGYFLSLLINVLGSASVALFISVWFTDFKLAGQVVGMFFSAFTFVGLNYNGDGGILDIIILAVPNSGFAIAVMEKNFVLSLCSIPAMLISFLGYLMIEYKLGPCKLFKCKTQGE